MTERSMKRAARGKSRPPRAVAVRAAAAAAAIAAALASAPALAQEPAASLPLKARLALFKAQEKRDKGEHAEAAGILYDFLSKNSRDDNCLVRYYLALSYAEAGEPEKSLDHFQKCLAFDSTFAQAWMKLGETAFNLGSYRIASDAFERGYALDERKTPDLLYYAATARYLSEDAAGALSLLEELLTGERGAPRIEWFRTYLAACNEASETERGRTAAVRLVELFSGNAEAWRLSHQFFASVRDYREAAATLAVVGFLSPLSRDEERVLGDLFVAIGIPALASTRYEAALGGEARVEDLERLASAYLASYDFETALETLERAIEREPTVRLWSLLGDLHLMERHYDRAYEAYRRSAAMDSTRGRPELMMGYCAYELGSMGDAVEHLERASNFADSEKTALELLERLRPRKP
jgi:tetratricopeptide (TPR) repeat protein